MAEKINIDEALDKQGLRFYDAIQKQRFSSCGTVENQETILSIVRTINEKIDFNNDSDGKYEEIAKKLEELI